MDILLYRIDSCESKVEVVTPYWASNSVGKTRAIVNTEHFEQAIHQEVCTWVYNMYKQSNNCVIIWVLVILILEQSVNILAVDAHVLYLLPYLNYRNKNSIIFVFNFQIMACLIYRKTVTTRCSRDCGCEQKYKWHRLLAYDPDNDCKGIFMDWFLFPSCCVCRCDSVIPNNV